MKRVWLCILLIAASVAIFFGNETMCFAKENKTTTEIDSLYAQSAVLMDADSGRVLFEKEGELILPMASTTKIMTCILALENGNLEDLVEVSAYAASMPDVQLNIRKGETYVLKDLLYSLMLESHNDSAVAIAEHIGGSAEGFAWMMNQKAREIGCKNTHFVTPNGLDAQSEVTLEDGTVKTVAHSTTAKDLSLIMSYCIKHSPMRDRFLEITRTPSYSFSNREGSRNFSCSNHNAFLNMMQGALSGKTGFTGKAGYCYVGALEREGKTFVVALLACGWPNHKTYKWSDTKKLMEYGISNYEKKDAANLPVDENWLKDIEVLDAKTQNLFGNAFIKVGIKDKQEPPAFLMKPGEEIQVECVVEQQLQAPVEKNQPVGTIRYFLDNEVVWEREICALWGLEKKDFAWYLTQVIWNFIKI